MERSPTTEATEPQSQRAPFFYDFSSSAIYTLFVGPSREKFFAHESVLRASPVFAAMCRGSFRESIEHQIKLPDDNPQAVNHLLEFLNTGLYKAHQKPPQKYFILTDLYILAEKYALDELKELAFFELLWVANDSELFFAVAWRIYDNTPDSDPIFPPFFKIVLYDMMLRKTLSNDELLAHLKRGIAEDDACARDVLDVCYSVYDMYYNDYNINKGWLNEAHKWIHELIHELLGQPCPAQSNVEEEELPAERYGAYDEDAREEIHALPVNTEERRSTSSLLFDPDQILRKMNCRKHFGSEPPSLPASSVLLASPSPTWTWTARPSPSRVLNP